MDAFILAFRNLCSDLLPILGAVALVCVIIFLIKLINVLSSVDIALVKTGDTIDKVDESIEKIQAPLDTVVRLSASVDKAHDATLVAVKDAKDFVVRNMSEAKDKVDSRFSSKDKEDEIDETKYPTVDDIVGDFDEQS